MPKKIWFAVGALVLGLSACNSNSNIYGGAVPTASPSPIPTGTIAVVTASYNGTRLPNQTINETTEVNGGPNTSATIATMVTNSTGQATFTGLTPGASYCWYFDYVVNSTTTTRQSACTNSWATVVVGT
ncbi:MAG TPA: hypothetical protein VIJ12_02070 [Candidatus Baltobacteraceae bacterium]